MAEASPVEGLDFEAALVQYRMEKTYIRILTVFLRSVPGILEKLVAFVDAGGSDGLNEYITTVHGLKGSSYGVQANYLGELAKDLEFAGKEGNVAFILENNARLIEETNALLARLKVYLDAQA